MSYVAINVLTVSSERASGLEERFAGRAGAVESAAGFEHFELLRPVDGLGKYLVYTRWRTKADFEAWTSSRSFERGHAGPPAASGAAPAAAASELWGFEVIQTAAGE